MTRNYEGMLRRSTQHLIAQAFQGPADTKKPQKGMLWIRIQGWNLATRRSIVDFPSSALKLSFCEKKERQNRSFYAKVTPILLNTTENSCATAH